MAGLKTEWSSKMDFLNVVKQLAPTVASALGGPLAGAAVTAIGRILGQESPNLTTIASAIEDGKLTADNIAEIRKLEMQILGWHKMMLTKIYLTKQQLF